MRFKEFLLEQTDRKLFTTKKEIENWFLKFGFGTKHYKINDDLSVDLLQPTLIGGVTFDFSGTYKYLPFNISSCSNNFTLRFIDCPNLKTLEGLPDKLETDLFIIRCNSLTNLQGAPKHLDKWPSTNLYVARCDNLVSLDGISKDIGNIRLQNLDKLDLDCLKSFNPRSLSLYLPQLSTLSDIDKILPEKLINVAFAKGQVKGNVLSLLKHKTLTKVYIARLDKDDMPHGASEEWDTIINKYLPNGDILDCQSELIDAGFKEYAKL